MGEGIGPQTEANAPAPGGSGGGGGGGGTASATPMAMIVITPDDVEVKPIFDLTQVGMAALAALSFNAFWIIRMMRNTSKAESAGTNFTPGMMRKWLKF
jgi:uncharacterized spore protein YtfJ